MTSWTPTAATADVFCDSGGAEGLPLSDVNASVGETAGNLFGTTRIRQSPFSSFSSNTEGGVQCSCPRQNGHGDAPVFPLAETTLSPNSFGRWARFSATNTERPSSQSVRSSGKDPSTKFDDAEQCWVACLRRVEA
jgi:hypothetical protein